jgi:alkylated DNA repair dioxygenase AlkB
MQIPLLEMPLLDGLAYVPDFLAPAEETELLRGIAALDFAPFQFQGWEGKRQTVSFGWSYDFSHGRLAPAQPIPQFLVPLRDRAAALAGIAPRAFEHALVIEYGIGAGIGWHRDRPVFDRVAGISLAAPCTLRFRRRNGRSFERAALKLAPRSAYVLDGAARHDWEHSILPMPVPRYSITFRSLAVKA